jgi:glycosyltransferase involved in cell wall biosynthesis
MRVLFVSQEMPPETGWGGIGTYVDVLSEALVARGLEVHVLSVVQGQQPSLQRLGGVTVHRRPLPPLRGAERLPRESWRRVWLAATVARLIPRMSIEPTVIECPEWMAEGLALTIRQTRPLVVRLHSSARQLFPFTGQGRDWHGMDGKLAARLEESSARRANVVVSTRSNLDEVTHRLRLNQQALHAIPYPVRLPDIAPMPDATRPRVTFVGRLEPRKAPEVLLRAAPRVLAAVPNVRFAFVGRDAIAAGSLPSTAWLRHEAQRLGVAHAIELPGQLDRAGVQDELRRATVCAFPSRWESFGNVVAEAAATGRPVVASPIAPFRELIQDGVTGRLAPLDDTDSWAAALIELLHDQRQAEEMGQAGAKRVAAISEPGHVAQLAHDSYHHALERWRARQRAGDG